jgi:hypothetical protein
MARRGQNMLWQSNKCNLAGLENREYGRRDPSRWQRGTFYPQKLALTSPTSDGRSVGIVRSRTQTTEIFFFSNLVTIAGIFWGVWDGDTVE